MAGALGGRPGTHWLVRGRIQAIHFDEESRSSRGGLRRPAEDSARPARGSAATCGELARDLDFCPLGAAPLVPTATPPACRSLTTSSIS
jgi:hypothetical protein